MPIHGHFLLCIFKQPNWLQINMVQHIVKAIKRFHTCLLFQNKSYKIMTFSQPESSAYGANNQHPKQSSISVFILYRMMIFLSINRDYNKKRQIITVVGTISHKGSGHTKQLHTAHSFYNTKDPLLLNWDLSVDIHSLSISPTDQALSQYVQTVHRKSLGGKHVCRL